MVLIKKFIWFLPVILVVLLSGCMSLAEDITPPPGLVDRQQTQETPQVQIEETTTSFTNLQDSPDTNQGADIFGQSCASCHGEFGLGDGPDSLLIENPVSAIGSVDLARVSEPLDWYTMVTNGNLEKFMPPFTSMSDQERWDVVSYLFTMSTPENALVSGDALFQENCAECHGEDGKQGVVDLSDLVSMSSLTTEDIFTTISTGVGLMPAFENLNVDDRWNIADFTRLLPFKPLQTRIDSESSNGETEPLGEDISKTSEIEEMEVGSNQGSVKVKLQSSVNEPVPLDFAITLRGYDQMVEVYSRTLELGSGPEIVFDDVPLKSGRIYFATTEHNNAVYGSGIATVDNGNSELALEIDYYPPSLDLSILHVDRLHVFIDFIDDETLEIYQLYIFSNPSDQVLVPEVAGSAAVNFEVPNMAGDLYVEENVNLAYQKTDNGFGISIIYPNENPYQTIFSYSVPYEDKKMDLSIPVSLNAQALILMAPASGFKIFGDQLENAGTQDFEGIEYNMFTSSNLVAGDMIDLSLSGRPKSGNLLVAPGDGNNLNLVIGLAGLGLAFIITGVFLWRRNRINDDVLYDDDFVGDTPDEIMDSIIVLDDQFKIGGLPEGAYRQRRAELKDQLKGFYVGDE